MLRYFKTGNEDKLNGPRSSCMVTFIQLKMGVRNLWLCLHWRALFKHVHIITPRRHVLLSFLMSRSVQSHFYIDFFSHICFVIDIQFRPVWITMLNEWLSWILLLYWRIFVQFIYMECNKNTISVATNVAITGAWFVCEKSFIFYLNWKQ